MTTPVRHIYSRGFSTRSGVPSSKIYFVAFLRQKANGFVTDTGVSTCTNNAMVNDVHRWIRLSLPVTRMTLDMALQFFSLLQYAESETYIHHIHQNSYHLITAADVVDLEIVLPETMWPCAGRFQYEVP